MLDPNNSEADAARVALLPLECSLKDIDRLFTSSDGPEEEFANRLQTYGLKALQRLGGPDEPPLVDSIGEIAIFSALMAIRVEFADPLRESHYYEQFPENSAERRMMERPLRNHPGLSLFTRDVRDQYVYDVLYAFQNMLSDAFQNEFVAILVAPDPEWESSPANPTKTYQLSRDKLRPICEDRITQCKGGFKVPFSHISGRTFVEPIGDWLHLPTLDIEELPALTKHDDGVVIPEDVVLAKLANYAWHSWYRLVHFVYNFISNDHVRSLIEATPQIGTEIRDHLNFRGPHRAFVPYYGSTTQNPLLDRDARDPISRTDKRLVTVADTIRASSDLEFDEPILLTRLFDEARQFFPSPDRPSNDVSDIQTLKNALDGVIDHRFSSSEMIEAYGIPSPIPTSFYLYEGSGFWQQYRHELAKLSRKTPTLPNTHRISPRLPKEWNPRTSPDYANARQEAERAAATQLKYDAWRLDTVEPLIDPEEFSTLSADEALFLTRVGLAMERRIKSYSLIESMTAFDETTEGEKLDIDVERLDEQDHLVRLPGRRTYYSVPWETRRLLGIPNTSHDGWGERSPSEGTRHRVGIDLSAFFIASQPEVDRVVRYCDIWRLKNTACWDAVSHLENKRLDVVGFSQREPRFICEVETKSGGTADTKGAVEKLAAFPDDVHRSFITPNGKHLPSLMSRLSSSGYFDIDFGKPKDGGYRPADVSDKLTEHGIIGEQFDDLLTYDNIRTQLPMPFNQSELSNLIVGAI